MPPSTVTSPAGEQQAPAPVGARFTGKIKSLSTGQGTGYIRTRDGRDFFFHKHDVEAKAYNNLNVGDSVSFEVIEDVISGARAQRVRTRRPPRPTT